MNWILLAQKSISLAKYIPSKPPVPDFSTLEKLLEERKIKSPDKGEHLKRLSTIQTLSRPTQVSAAEEVAPSETARTGTACLSCVRDHLSTVASALSEAVRFAREGGVRDAEALRRISLAEDELNIAERIDLAPEVTAKLKGEDRVIAQWVLPKARELRHNIGAIRDVEDLEKVAAQAAGAKTEFIEKLMGCLECEALSTLHGWLEKRKAEKQPEV